MSAASIAKGTAKSKIMWLGLAVAVGGQMLSQESVLGPFIPEKWRGLVFALLGIGIMVARFFTDQSLAEKGESSNET